MEKVSLASLGCSKNLIDAEQMLGILTDAGYEIVENEEDADILIVNTCTFIESAKMESIECILELAQYKKAGKCQHLIVTGCMAQRYKEQVLTEIPEVDAVVGTNEYPDIVSVIEGLKQDGNREFCSDVPLMCQELPRLRTTPAYTAYLKIAEGCDNRCTYCVIPSIRGKYRSRKMEDILREAEQMAQEGVKELIVIAQDITRYGTDLYGKRSLAKLCNELAKIEGIEWIRLHYLYPDQFDDELIDEIASNDKVVKYLDIPIQHINNKILKAMNRRGTGEEIRELFKKLRDKIPGLVIRTSLIAGLPGEGEAEFEELCEFLREARIERVGVFPFSPEEGTPAAKMAHVDFEEAQRRADLVMELQAPIMDEFCQSFCGKTIKVLYEYYDEESQYHVGRCYADSPDIDGEVHFAGCCKEGDIVDVLITSAEDGILYGEEV